MNVERKSNNSQRGCGKRNIVSTEIATALDRIRVSDRKAVHILVAAAKSLGFDTNKIAINR